MLKVIESAPLQGMAFLLIEVCLCNGKPVKMSKCGQLASSQSFIYLFQFKVKPHDCFSFVTHSFVVSVFVLVLSKIKMCIQIKYNKNNELPRSFVATIFVWTVTPAYLDLLPCTYPQGLIIHQLYLLLKTTRGWNTYYFRQTLNFLNISSCI